QQQASSSSTSSTSSKPSVNQGDTFRSTQLRTNRFNGGKKYVAGQTPRPTQGDKVYDAKSERSNGAKFSRLNGGRLAPSYRKNAGRNGANRRDDVPQHAQSRDDQAAYFRGLEPASPSPSHSTTQQTNNKMPS
ncbi:hypothetical protein BpHYR1_018661, partial [Brachionus plicatilis]